MRRLIETILALWMTVAVVASDSATGSDDPTTIATTIIDGSTEETSNQTPLDPYCWLTAGCQIAAEFRRPHIELAFPANIDCKDAHPQDLHASPYSWRANPYNNISQISLNGCNVNRNDTIGVEFVPDPTAVRQLEIQMFRIADAIAANTFIAYAALETIVLMHNVIPRVANGSLHGLVALQTLTLEHNRIEGVDDAAFGHLSTVNRVTIREPLLEIVASMELPSSMSELEVEVRSLYWWNRLPESIHRICIYHSQVYLMAAEQSDFLRNDSSLEHFQLNHCNASSLPQMYSHSLKVLNISNNRLTELISHHLPVLDEYDLSYNELRVISDLATRSMLKLRRFLAHHNHIETIAPNTFKQNAYLELVDISSNQLRRIAPNLSAQQNFYIQIDHNPWDCKWLPEFDHNDPQTFNTRLRYTKVFSGLNYKLLRCIDFTAGHNSNGSTPVISPTAPVVPPFLYRRNPKDTAVLTLIILVVGVAFLFLLLFLHIKCRRDALQPFNRFLRADESPPHRIMGGGHRADFVRRDLPATQYETPILCNAALAREADEDEKRLTDNGYVYEEIPERESSVTTIQGKDATTSNDLADGEPNKWTFLMGAFE